MNTNVPSSKSFAVAMPPLGLAGTLSIPNSPLGLIIFAHGSDSSHLSPRNMAVAEALNALGFGTLLFDLLSPSEERDRANVFDISLLAERLLGVVKWAGDQDPPIDSLPIGLFGASTGAAAALVAAARLPDRIRAVVSRGGRPDLARDAIPLVRAPTLLIVGGSDFGVMEMNKQALARLRAPKALETVFGATHLFQEPGAMEVVIGHAGRWFERYL
jgi:putative phosphoribosyl transferase